MRYVHFKRFFHGNLNPQNIFYNGENLLIMGWENVTNLLENKNP